MLWNSKDVVGELYNKRDASYGYFFPPNVAAPFGGNMTLDTVIFKLNDGISILGISTWYIYIYIKEIAYEKIFLIVKMNYRLAHQTSMHK